MADLDHDSLPTLEARLSMPISNMSLTNFVKGRLIDARITTLRDLVQKNETDLLKLRSFGRKSLREVKNCLAQMTLSLGMKLDQHGDEGALDPVIYQLVMTQNRQLNDTVNMLRAEKKQLYDEVDGLRAAKSAAEGKLREFSEAKDVEEKLATTVSKAEKIAASVSDPSLRPTAYAFALQTIYAASRPNQMRIPMGMPLFLGL